MIDVGKYEALCRKMSLTHRTVSRKDELEAKKYWFTSEFLKNKHADAATVSSVFDEAMRAKEKERLLYFKLTEALSDNGRNMLRSNPFFAKYSQIPSVTDPVREMCRLVGIQNTHDSTVSIPDSTLMTNESSLRPVLLNLTRLLRIRVSQEKISLEAQMRRLLSSVLNHYSGAKLVTKRERIDVGKTPQGKRAQASVTSSRIHIEDGFLRNVVILLTA